MNALAEGNDGEVLCNGRHLPVPSLVIPLAESFYSDPLQLGNIITEVLVIQYQGCMDDEALQRAFQLLVDRHDALRTSFHLEVSSSEHSRSSQVPDGDGDFISANLHPVGSVKASLEVLDLTEYAVDHEAVLQRLETIAQRGFQLESPPLVRVAVAHVADQRHVVMLCRNHCVMDGGSQGVWLRELAALYSGASSHDLPTLEAQPGEYAAWLRERRTDRLVKKQTEFWKKKLAGAPQALNMPLERSRPHQSSCRGKPVVCVVNDVSMLDDIHNFMSRERQSLIRVMTAAYAYTLSIYSGDEDLVLLFPRMIKPPHMSNMIGHFVNALPLRLSMDDKRSFRDTVKYIGAEIKEAVAHGDITFGDIMACLGSAQSHALLAKASITIWEKDWACSPSLPNLQAETCQLKPWTGRANEDLFLQIADLGTEIHLRLILNEEIFSTEFGEQMINSMMAILQQGLKSPNSPIEAIIAPNQEAIIAGRSMGEQRAEYADARLVHDAFAAIAMSHPDLECLVFQDQRLTYGEVYHRVRTMAARLVNVHGVGPGVVVGVMLDRSLDLVVTILAVLTAGGCYLPCDPSYPDDRLSVYVEDAGSSLLLTEPAHLDRATAMAAASGRSVSILDVNRVLSSVDDGGSGTLPFDRPVAAGPEDPAYIIFTSGSTGRPKGVTVPHRGLQDFAHFIVDEYALGTTSVSILTNTICFDASVYQLFPPLIAGACMIVASPQGHLDPDYIARTVVEHQVTTFLVSVPTLALEYLSAMKRLGFAPYGAMQSWGLGGESVPAHLVREMQEVFPNMKGPHNAYGPTEATVTGTHYCFPRGFDMVVIGRPDPNMHAYVVDSSLRPLPLGVPGELLLSGPRLALGYCGRPDLTAKSFVDNPCLGLLEGRVHASLSASYCKAYRTGDLVRWRSDGTLEFLGRIDRQVKITGVRIELGEVESALESFGGVAQAVACAMADPSGEKRLVGYVCPADLDVQLVLSHCRSLLMAAMVPSTIVALDAFPLQPNGKVDVRALPQPEWDLTVPVPGEENLDELEQTLLDIWADVLALDAPISIHADFFALGGNSLKAGVVQARIRDALELKVLPSNALFVNPTIFLLAEFLRQEEVQGRTANSFKYAWLAGRGRSSASLLRRATTFLNKKMLHHLNAEDPDLSNRLGTHPEAATLPFPLYIVFQYLLLVLVETLPILPWAGQYLGWVFLTRAGWNLGWLVLLWPPFFLAGIFLQICVFLLFHRILFPFGMSPGVHPLYGWVHCRWATARALQSQNLGIIYTFFCKTSVFNCVYRCLGAKIGAGARIDTVSIHEPGLVEIGEGTKIGRHVNASPAMIAPAGMFGDAPVLMFSTVIIGSHCEVGHRAILPAGGRLVDRTHLKPRSSPAHKNAVGPGNLEDCPEFMPEQHLGELSNLTCSFVSMFLHSLSSLVAIVVGFALVGVTLGGNPFDLILKLRFGDRDGGRKDILGVISLFFVYFNYLGVHLAWMFQVAVLLFFKTVALRCITPGTRISANASLSWRFSLYRRLISDSFTQLFASICGSTPIMSWFYRNLGAKIGNSCFVGGLDMDLPDTINISGAVSSGSESAIRNIDGEGIVREVSVSPAATIGNSAVLYGGSSLGKLSVLGNDSALASGTHIPDLTRKQGSMQYRTEPDKAILALLDDDKSESRVWYSLRIMTALWLLSPVTYILRWFCPVLLTIVVLDFGHYAGAVFTFIGAQGFGFVLAALWIRVLSLLCGIRSRWKAGEGQVFSVPTMVAHGLLSATEFLPLAGTPFLSLVARIIGFSVGKGVVLLQRLPLERDLVTFEDGAVVEGGCTVEGHYLETLKFKYHPTTVGKQAWVQVGSRVMPEVTMQQGSRLLPASTVLPGGIMHAGWIWGGGMPASPWMESEA